MQRHELGEIAVLIPFKGYKRSKSRLAELGDPARLGLACAVLTELCSVVSDTFAAEHCYLVAPCDPELVALVSRFRMRLVKECSDAGLNGAVAAAAAHLAVQGYKRVIVLHADLPLANRDALRRLVDMARDGRSGLVTDTAGCGTKALLVPLPLPFLPSFGADSAARHRSSAIALGMDMEDITMPELAFDMNTPADVYRLGAFVGSSMPIGPRIRAALAGTDGAVPVDAFDWLANMPSSQLAESAASLRDVHWGRTMTYSRKVFIPLTRLCRDVCHYCTFATRPRMLSAPYLSLDEVLDVARRGEAQGCKEALFTLGDRPEMRYRDAREALAEMGHATTIDYLVEAAKAVCNETGLLPHVNAGLLSPKDIAQLRPWMGSAGLMLESGAEHLSEKGQPHYGSPDKVPARRLATLEALGIAKVPTTTGLLIGIGETREDRLHDLAAIAAMHRTHGHIQEVILQNFRAKPGTLMADVPDASLEELLWTISVARLILPPEISLQAPPNLNPGATVALIRAGINDWGGISPVTPDHVNPEAPWPEIEALRAEVDVEGMQLEERLTLYPRFVRAKAEWSHSTLHARIDLLSDGAGLARSDTWTTGRSREVPAWFHRTCSGSIAPRIVDGLDRICEGVGTEEDVAHLFTARGPDFEEVLRRADSLRWEVNGDTVTYVINRNINYTNICYFKCRFCGFSKGRTHDHLRGKPYNLGLDEIRHRVIEAAERGATEVCLQGGIHPDYTGQTYLDICSAIRAAVPGMHIHAFSPLEIAQGARTLGMTLEGFLRELLAAGLSTLPGTAAEILDDEVRDVLCHDKLNTAEWFEVVETAHMLGLKSTATIMFGHIDGYEHWARHLLRLRTSALRTRGYTEFVPLPFVAHEAPMVLKGMGRLGPTFRETMLMHAVARLVLYPAIPNIQASWVKLGDQGVQAALRAGVNDLGGTLMDETITRSSGGAHGSEMTPDRLEAVIRAAGRLPMQRTTTYAPATHRQVALGS